MDDKTRKYVEDQMNLDDLYEETFKDSKVLEDLNAFCNLDSVCFKDDSRLTAYMLGQRSVALYIKERVNHTFTKKNENRKEKTYV